MRITSDDNKKVKPSMSRTSKSKFNIKKLMFRKKPDEQDLDETFTSKREKDAKKRKHKLTMIAVLCLMVGGSITGMATPLLRNINVAAEKKVPSSGLTNSANDAAAKAILNGDTVKVKNDDKSKDSGKTVSQADANKAITDAVKAQADSDNDKLTKLSDAMKTATDDVASLKSQVDTLTKANNDLTDSNQSLTTENAKLKSSTNNSDTETQYKKQIEDLQAQLKTAQDTIDRAKVTLPK